MDSIEKTINGRAYVFSPKGASAESLDLYFQMQALLLPLLGSVADSIVAPLLESGDLNGALGEGSGGDKATAKDRMLAVAPKILAAASEHSSFASMGGALGSLAGNPKFRDLVLKLFEAGLEVVVEFNDDGVPRAQRQKLGKGAAAHFGRHLGDFIPAAYWILQVNYRQAFIEAFGGLLTQTEGALGAAIVRR